MNATKIVDLIATEHDVTTGEPTGRCREVIRAAVTDYGGNVYGYATTSRGLARVRKSIRVPTTVRADRLGGYVSADAHHPEYTTDCGCCLSGE